MHGKGNDAMWYVQMWIKSACAGCLLIFACFVESGLSQMQQLIASISCGCSWLRHERQVPGRGLCGITKLEQSP